MDDQQNNSAMRSADAAPPQLAGFWRRLFAAILDTLILGIAGWIIGNSLYDQVISLGQYGRGIGFPIAFLYFALLNSTIGAGGSLGKKALGIRVVNRAGQSISLARSLWRTAIYLIPFYLNGLDLSFLPLTQSQAIVAATVTTFLVFGIAGATIYLYLANWRTRQVMHDLAANTFVVRATSADQTMTQHINRLHLFIISVWLLFSLAAVPLAARLVPRDWQVQFGNAFGVDFNALEKIREAVLADPHIHSANANAGATTLYVNGRSITTTSLSVTAIWRSVPSSPEAAADSVAARILSAQPDILGKQILTVNIRYGFDLGIVQSWNGATYSYSPSEWRARIRRANPNDDI